MPINQQLKQENETMNVSNFALKQTNAKMALIEGMSTHMRDTPWYSFS